MSKNPADARNLEYLNKQVKKLKKSDALPHQHNCQTAVAQDFGFPAWDSMVAYVKGRPRRENGGVVISETPGLTLEQALNERAALQGMPPLGTTVTSEYGLDWEIVNYEFYKTPTTFARYPGDCDFLPVVAPLNISHRLNDFIMETDRCTSKRIVFVDTMPKEHPLQIGQNIHCANYSGDPEESYIFLDVAHAHETIFAHEIAHLWLIYVNGGDGCRVLRDQSDNGKTNQLDFLQSFVLDLKVNDLIAERGFDISLINQDQIDTLTMLRDAINLGHQPLGPREALVNSMSIAAAILEQKRWSEDMKQRLVPLLDFYAVVMPEMHNVAQQLVKIVERHGYDTQEALRKILDEVITLGFRATGDDFDLERDLREPQLNESMQDKYPEQFLGLPVALKLEIGKTMARHGISGEGQVWLSETSGGIAQITVEDRGRNKIGPLSVNYQLTPYHLTAEYQQLNAPNRHIGGKLSNSFGRLPGEPGYNTGLPPRTHPLELTAHLVNGMMPDDFGRMPGELGYNTSPNLGAFSGMSVTVVNGQLLVNGQVADQHGRLVGHPSYNSPLSPNHDPFKGMLPHLQIPAAAMAALKHLPGQQWPAVQNQYMLPPQAGRAPQNVFAPVRNPQQLPFQHPPILAEPEQTSSTNLTRRYMAGVGLSIARARLMQQMVANGTNLYKYADNNPITKIDPSGLSPYDGYNHSYGIEVYNCAGLAFRKYQWISYSPTINALSQAVSTPCERPCDANHLIKFWLWTFTSNRYIYGQGHGNPVLTISPDFHIVAGKSTCNNGVVKDPTSIWSKDGTDPVLGPAAPLTFKPKSTEIWIDNSNNPPVKYWIERMPMTQKCFCMSEDAVASITFPWEPPV